MFKKLKAIAKRGKAVICMAAATVVTAVCAVCASAETAEATNYMETTLKSAGSQISEQFSTLVATLIPVVIGIFTSGLVFFGIFSLVKFAKKTFNKVAG